MVAAAMRTATLTAPTLVPAATHASAWSGHGLRVALALGSLGAVGVALWLGDPRPSLAADADLARLLRGMALLKAALVVPALGLLWWRFGRPVSPLVSAVYVPGAWLLAGASALIWQLTWLPLAAATFHVAGLAVLLAAWRDDLPLLAVLKKRR